MRVLLAGGTGLVGNAVIEASKTTKLELVGVGRRASGKLSREIVTDFEDIPNLPTAQVAICTLGTTQHRAGSREAFRAVDYTAVMKFATAAQLADAEHFVVVTAVGATTRSSIFYSRVKGEVESDLSTLGFTRLDIVRPGLLLGTRTESRPVESFLQTIAPLTDSLMRGSWRKYRSVSAEALARYLLALATRSAPGIFIHHHGEITAGLAGNGTDVT